MAESQRLPGEEYPVSGRRYGSILPYTGFTLMLTGFLMLIPLICLAFWPEEKAISMGFIVPALIMIVSGGVIWFGLKPMVHPALTRQEGSIIVFLTWIVVCAAGAFPFMSVLGLGFVQALFESVSGFTTTGLSVVDVTAAPRSILLWRSVMQLAGGAGFAILMLTALAGPSGTGISGAEGRTDQLVPHVRKSAALVLSIYLFYAVAGFSAYLWAGMSPFDAVNHAFAAISTGGFSTRPDSIGYWDSFHIEMVTYPLMLLGSLNFITAYLLFTGRFRAVFRNAEVRFSLLLLLAAIVLVYFRVCRDLYPALSKDVRVAVFEAITALTTTGFSTVGYGNWNSFGYLILLLLMLIGGGTGSTAGGMKQFRVCLLLKSLYWEIRRGLLPSRAMVEYAVWMGERPKFVEADTLRRVALFSFLYLVVYALGVGIMTAHGYGLQESLFEFASTIGTVGLSVGVTSPDAPVPVLVSQIIGMFLGRLEFFVVFIALARLGRDAFRMPM